MNEKLVPQDHQVGDPLAGPACFPPRSRPRSRSVAAFGLDPQRYLAKAILWEVFGVPGIRFLPSEAAGTEGIHEDAVLVDRPPENPPSWEHFCRWLGDRPAVVDIEAAAAMARAGGSALRTGSEPGNREGALTVFHRRMSTEVYPGAPRVRIEAEVAAGAGFAVGDEIHLYHPEGEDLALDGLVCDAAFERFLADQKAVVWGRTTGRGLAALVTIATPARGEISIMDLRAVDREPEPSGVETLASQVLLSALSGSAVTFGRFLRPHASYDDYVAVVSELAGAYPELASVEPIGRSQDGRTLCLLKVALNPDAPAVLLTCGIHPLEWATCYGVLRYVRFLLEQCRADTEYARRLMADRQLWWVLCAYPDGWESREHQFNINRNFPGGWKRCMERDTYWDAYNRRFAPMDLEPRVAFGPEPGSQPETRALMSLLERGPRVVTLADFHETTAFDSFLHQHELPDGSVPDMPYHRELVEGFAGGFNGRFYAHGNVLARRPGLNEFSTYRLRGMRVEGRLMGSGQAGRVPSWSGTERMRYSSQLQRLPSLGSQSSGLGESGWTMPPAALSMASLPLPGAEVQPG